MELIYGRSGTLVATVSPNNASNKNVTWSTSDSRVVSVDNNGNVKATGIGQATITAKTSNGKTATATVYADVESITVRTSTNSISNYGGTNTATLTVSTVPSINLDQSMYRWVAPDTSGYNSYASLIINGKTATLKARDCWSKTTIPVYVSIGRNSSSKVYIEVEQKINLTHSLQVGTGGIALVAKNTNVTINSNVDIEDWTYDTEKVISNVNKTSRAISFRTRNDYNHPEGFTITARTKAGQTAKLIITVNN